MASFDDDLTISVMEELDPDPPSNGRFRHSGEVLIGLVLLLGVITWSGWQWWDQQQMESHYHLAQQAALRKDLDEALASYLAAGEYRDAAERADEIAQLIDERDRQYNATLEFARREEWPSSFEAVETVREIQPGYRDIEELAAEAEKHIYRMALDGTIAMRTEADPPGLYWRVGDSWLHLRGSDRWSSILGAGYCSCVVYHAPTVRWKASSLPAQAAGSLTPGQYPRPGSPALKDRQLVVAFLSDGALSFKPLSFEPTTYNYYVAGERGVWALRYNPIVPMIPGSHRQYWLGRKLTDFGHFVVSYQSFSDPRMFNLTSSSRSWVVMDLMPGGEYALLAEMTRADEGGMTSSLYLVNANGTDRRLLYTYNGSFRTARFSADGEYVLFTAYGPTFRRYNSDYDGTNEKFRYSERQAVVLLSRANDWQPQVLAQKVARTNPPASNAPPPLAVDAAFLHPSAFGVRVLVANWGTSSSTITLLHPATGDEVTIKASASGGPVWEAWVSEMGSYEGDDVILAAWQQQSQSSYQPQPQLGNIVFSRLSPYEPSVSLQTRPGRGRHLWDASIRDDHLVYITRSGMRRTEHGSSFSVYALPLSDLDSGHATHVPLHAVDLPNGLAFPFAAPWSLGPEMFAYASSGRLHARTYDGQIDVPLEHGVTALYNPTLYDGFNRLR